MSQRPMQLAIVKAKAPKLEELPKFDHRRAFPDRDLTTWQRPVNFLEKGESPKIKSRTVCLCQGVGQNLDFWRWPRHGVSNISTQVRHLCLLYLLRRLDRMIRSLGVPRKPCFLSFGNHAMKKALLAHLDGTEVQFDQVDPKRITMKTVPKTDIVTLRVRIC